MDDGDMLNLLNNLSVGDTISVTVELFFGSDINVEGRYMGNLTQHGYYSKCGGWNLYSIKKYMPEIDEVPCYQFDFKGKRKRSNTTLKIGFQVKAIKIM